MHRQKKKEGGGGRSSSAMSPPPPGCRIDIMLPYKNLTIHNETNNIDGPRKRKSIPVKRRKGNVPRSCFLVASGLQIFQLVVGAKTCRCPSHDYDISIIRHGKLFSTGAPPFVFPGRKARTRTRTRTHTHAKAVAGDQVPDKCAYLLG